MLTQAKLKELYDYCPDTGIFTTKTNTQRGRWVTGRAIYSCDSEGYVRISVLGHKKMLAHRAAFLYMLGRMPVGEVDHINGIRNDNRFCNLRDVNKSKNQRNSKPRKTNGSGYKGVQLPYKGARNWRASHLVDGKRIHLGMYDTPEAAAESYDLFVLALDPDYYYTNFPKDSYKVTHAR